MKVLQIPKRETRPVKDRLFSIRMSLSDRRAIEHAASICGHENSSTWVRELVTQASNQIIRDAA